MRITYVLFLLVFAVYVSGNPMSLALWPLGSDEFRLWQLVTYAFVHGNLAHAAINMLALGSFGPSLVRAWGWKRFLLCYLLAAAVGGALQAWASTGPVVGASGALFGLFAAYVISKPHARLVTLWPTSVTAWKLLAVYLVITALAVVFDLAPMVAHIAHLGGTAVGVAFALNNKPHR